MQRQETQWTFAVVMLLGGILAATHLGKIPPLLARLQADLDIGITTAGWIASIFNILGATAGIAAGTLADRAGRRAMLLLGLAGLAGGNLLGAVSYSVAMLLVSRSIEGAGYILCMVSFPALIADASAPRHQRITLGLWGATVPVGVMLAMFVAVPISQMIGWRSLWIGLAAICAVFAAAVYLLPPVSGQGDRPKVSLRGLRETFSTGGPVILAASFAFYSFQWFALITWMPILVTRAGTQDAATAGIIAALIVGANILGNLLGSLAVQKGAARWLLLSIAATTISICGFAVFALPLPEPAMYLLAAIASGVSGILPPSVYSSVPLYAARSGNSSAINGSIMQGANLGALLGPPVIAMSFAWTNSWTPAGFVLMFCGCVGVALAFVLRRVEALARKRSGSADAPSR